MSGQYQSPEEEDGICCHSVVCIKFLSCSRQLNTECCSVCDILAEGVATLFFYSLLLENDVMNLTYVVSLYVYP
jgi:hypothetical protein